MYGVWRDMLPRYSPNTHLLVSPRTSHQANPSPKGAACRTMPGTLHEEGPQSLTSPSPERHINAPRRFMQKILLEYCAPAGYR